MEAANYGITFSSRALESSCKKDQVSLTLLLRMKVGGLEMLLMPLESQWVSFQFKCMRGKTQCNQRRLYWQSIMSLQLSMVDQPGKRIQDHHDVVPKRHSLQNQKTGPSVSLQ
jgi:hypothetical protein